MLDKSIEYKNIIMKIEHDKIKDIPSPMLPDGFSFRFFEEGDEVHWARIESSVLEFDSTDAAMDYFKMSYLPYREELQKRCIFVLNKDRLPIATANSWFANSDQLGYQASLHWLACCPEYQGLGIGKAIMQQALINFQKLDPGYPVWLHTQTWSHVAIWLYHRLGFNLMKSDTLANNNTENGIPEIYKNDFGEAIQVLKKIMSIRQLDELYDASE